MQPSSNPEPHRSPMVTQRKKLAKSMAGISMAFPSVIAIGAKVMDTSTMLLDHLVFPVLNMQCDVYHPFQCLADLMTIIEKKGKDLRRKKMVVSWAYAASYQKPMSVPQSLILQMPRFGMDVVLSHPPEFKLMPEIMEQAKEQAKKFGTSFEVVDDMDEGFKDADIVYAKSWGAMVQTPDPEEGAKIIKKYESWITDERRMKLAKGDAIYMHPLPADRNIEVMDAVIDGQQSVVYDEAENRIHVQKAVMALTM